MIDGEVLLDFAKHIPLFLPSIFRRLSMYAIIETGGKQYRVEKDDVIDVELLKEEAAGKVAFDHVLFLSDLSEVKIGSPYVEGGIVRGEVLQEIKGPKTLAYKYKKRKGYRKKKGHRQRYLKVKITEISG